MNKRNHESADRNNMTAQNIVNALEMTGIEKSSHYTRELNRLYPQRGNGFNILLTANERRSKINILDRRSNFKAELVRNELLARNDLMKLYHPPLKKS